MRWWRGSWNFRGIVVQCHRRWWKGSWNFRGIVGRRKVNGRGRERVLFYAITITTPLTSIAPTFFSLRNFFSHLPSFFLHFSLTFPIPFLYSCHFRNFISSFISSSHLFTSITPLFIPLFNLLRSNPTHHIANLLFFLLDTSVLLLPTLRHQLASASLPSLIRSLSPLPSYPFALPYHFYYISYPHRPLPMFIFASIFHFPLVPSSIHHHSSPLLIYTRIPSLSFSITPTNTITESI